MTFIGLNFSAYIHSNNKILVFINKRCNYSLLYYKHNEVSSLYEFTFYTLLDKCDLSNNV